MAQWGDTDAPASVPNFTENANNTFFVDTTEAAVTANRAKGLKTGGWNYYEEYGSGRKRVEVLVAMRRTAAEAGDLGAENDTTIEDATVADSD